MRTVNFSEARTNLKAVLDRVIDDADVTIITRRDADDVVIMSLDTWNSWKETEYLLASPANARHLREGIARLNAGQREYHELIVPVDARQVQEAKAKYRIKPASESTAPRKRAKKRG